MAKKTFNLVLDHAAKTLIVPKLSQPIRLDKFLIAQFPSTSRSYWKVHLANLRLNGKVAQKSTPLFGGEVLNFAIWPETKKPSLTPNPDIPLSILYEDEFILAVDKPAGLPCLPLKSEETKTVIHAVLASHPQQAGIDAETWEAGLIHRLDNDTSGVLLFAKTVETKAWLKQLNQKGQIQKQYQCWVRGQVGLAGEISTPIAHHPKNNKKMIVVLEEKKIKNLKARPASTQYKPLQFKNDFSLLEVTITKGARHQIRVHLASLGYPIVWDALYDLHPALPHTHHLLHAWRVNLIHPHSKKALLISSPLPKDFFPKL